MNQQLDMFSHQLDLLAPLASVLPPAAEQRIRGGMPPGVADAWERAYGLEVRQAFLDVAMKRPGEWIDSGDFYRLVAVPHNVGCCWGHAMGAMARAGMLEVKNHYYGSEFPGPGYRGYNHLYRWRFPMSGAANV